MVCSQLSRLEEWPSLDQHERTLLLFTAIFHDSAKPETSRLDPESGRIQSPKHAVKGEHLARNVLREAGCDLATREEIARLVRFHGRPAFLLEKPDPIQEVISLSWLVSNKLLFLFALADTRGRTTASMSRPEENLHLLEARSRGERLLFKAVSVCQRSSSLSVLPAGKIRTGFTCRMKITAARSRSCRACRAAARTLGWRGIERSCRLYRSTTFVPNSDVEATDDQGGVIQHAKSDAENCCGRERPSPSALPT